MNKPTAFPPLIIRAVETLGSQEAVATVVGVTRVTVQNWINDKHLPKGMRRQAIEAALDQALELYDVQRMIPVGDRG